MNSQTARAAILARIQDALKAEAADHATPLPNYRRVGITERAALVERFAERVAEYKAVVHRCAATALAATISAACARRAVQRLLVPPDLPPAWAPTGIDLLRDPGLTLPDLDSSDGVLTGCALGIAQTGTIVLDGGPIQGRRVLTLLPDYHLCVVFAAQIVDLVPEAFVRLGPAVREQRRPLTFISGPSATSDIELNRVEGVHGPRTLEVIVVDP